MTTARDLLERFRPAGTPGAAAPAGVPADRERSLREELQPVLDLLAPTEAQCDGVREQAERAAERLAADASARASASLAAARTRSEAARADAAARQRRRSDRETQEQLAAAERAAQDLTARAGRRSPAVVDRVLEAVRSGLAASERAGP